MTRGSPQASPPSSPLTPCCWDEDSSKKGKRGHDGAASPPHSDSKHAPKRPDKPHFHDSHAVLKAPALPLTSWGASGGLSFLAYKTQGTSYLGKTSSG